MMNSRQRIETCLSGEKPDRVPVALWRHFPVDDQTPEGLATATVDWQHTFDFDLVKVTPTSSFCLKDWGSQDEWHGATEGTRDYTHYVVQEPEDWLSLPVLNPDAPYLATQLRVLKLITDTLGSNIPVIQTIFNPLSQAKNLVGPDKLAVHLRLYPDAVHEALKTITESTIRFTEAAKATGIAGFFFAVQHAQYSLLTEAEYAEFGRTYDLQSLEPAKDSWLNMLHLHGEDVMFDRFSDYPIHVINWHDRDTEPSLKQALTRTASALCGGLQRERTMVLGTPEAVLAEAKDAIAATDGKRLILGTGCVLPIIAPRANILAARQAVES